jgi:hypothetical protein
MLLWSTFESQLLAPHSGSAPAVPEVKFNAAEPGITATELGGGASGSHPGRPAEVSAPVVARLATIGQDGPTGTFQEDDGELGW